MEGERNIHQKNYPKTQNKNTIELINDLAPQERNTKTELDSSILTSPCRSTHLTDWCLRILYEKEEHGGMPEACSC